MLWPILVAFLFRLACGLATAMALTSSLLVTPGFFRVHLWVGMGLNTFIAAVVLLIKDFPHRTWVIGVSALAALLSYVGAVVWLYERRRPGRWLLIVVAAVDFYGALLLDGKLSLGSVLDAGTASLLLGSTFAAMLLGHWYLNTPGMKLSPLQRLVVLIAVAVLFRVFIAGSELFDFSQRWQAEGSSYTALLALRWLTGLAGVLAMAGMTWQTLKIPNTQSATGILYVAVIFVFLGELTSQLLSVPGPHPV